MKQQPEQSKSVSASSQQPSINGDETTNGSSIIEFLNQEQNCLNSTENEVATELDIDSIFEEINRLSDESDERSVDEILREAELLLSKRQQIRDEIEDEVDDTADATESNELNENVHLYGKWHFNDHLDTISEKTTPQNTKSQSSDSRDDQTLQTIDDLESDTHVSIAKITHGLCTSSVVYL